MLCVCVFCISLYLHVIQDFELLCSAKNLEEFWIDCCKVAYFKTLLYHTVCGIQV